MCGIELEFVSQIAEEQARKLGLRQKFKSLGRYSKELRPCVRANKSTINFKQVLNMIMFHICVCGLIWFIGKDFTAEVGRRGRACLTEDAS